jgi:WXG100 family type VII secretion target
MENGREVSGMAQVPPFMMRQAAEEAIEAQTDLSTRLTRLEQDVASSHSGFQGPAGAAFQNTYPLLHQEMAAILTEIDRMAVLVGAGATRHDTVEQTSGQSIGGVVSLLNPRVV